MHKRGPVAVAICLIATLMLFGSEAFAEQRGAALINAAKQGDLKQVQELLDKGVDVNAKDENGVTALMEAYGGGHIEIMKLLLAAEAEIDAKDIRKGMTILMAASTMGQAEIVKLLLEWEPDVDAKADNGSTALALASYAGWPEAVKLLLEAEADVNARTNNGATPLMLASLKVDARTHAASTGDKRTMAQLMPSRADHAEVVKLLLGAKADTEAKAANGATALMMAASEGHIDIVKLLLEAKADANAKNENGGTALLAASQKGHNKVVELLKMHGAKE